ncbi:dienelactone hydrolase family protein [Nonomuraea sp. B1E8]|uniref:dienelactone hydrolase family protein n=1 Tax=unclassified Nonomuraea TaxID=2593643 RepID=UPI00325D02E1
MEVAHPAVAGIDVHKKILWVAIRLPGEHRRERLRALGVDHDATIYLEAGHSFMTDGHHLIASLALFPLRHGLVRPAADDAWRRTLSFFDRHVAGRRLGGS